MATVTKGDWLQAGLDTLAKDGVDGLTIQSLTDQLGVTKGSFYHHFSSIRSFKDELIHHWADQYFSTATDLPRTSAERLALLDMVMEEAFASVTAPEAAIRAWAQRDQRVQAVVIEVDATRKQFVLNIFRSLVASDDQASLMADLFSAMLIGCVTSLPQVPAERVLELYGEFKRLYGLEAGAVSPD